MGKIKIIVVEEDIVAALDIKKALESFGYEVTHVASRGEDAISKAVELMPNLVLMDIILKGEMDGIEAAQEIKKLDIPIVYLTTYSDELAVQETNITEPYGFIINPYERMDLKYAVELAIYKKKMEKELKKSQREKLETLDKLNEAQQLAKIGSWDWNLKTNKVWWSEETYRIFGVNSNYVPSYEKNSDYIHPEDLKTYQKAFKNTLETGEDLDFDLRVITESGTLKYCNTHGRVIMGDSGQPERIIGTLMDISERKLAEEKIDRLYRVYATLSQVNQAVVRVKDKEELFNTICKVCVEYGKFEMAWIGLIDPTTGFIRPIAIYGHEDGYLNKISISAHEKPSLDRPSTMALSTGKIVVINDIKKQLKRSWRDEAIARNYRSMTSIPIKLHEEVIGIFNVYSSESNFFTGEENKLVNEMGMDISMAVTAIEIEKERKMIESALAESEKNYQGLFNSMLDGFAVHEIILDDAGQPVDFRFLKVNPAFEELTGIKAEDIIGKTVREVLPNSDPIWIEKYGQVALSGDGKHFKDYNAELNRYYKVSAFSNKKGEFATIFEDVSDQRKAERAIKSSLKEKEVLLKEIHHRVKNNLQIISSLLNLQIDQVKDEDDKELFRISQIRVKSMALIHEKLYRSPDLSRIDFGEYVNNLTLGIISSYSADNINLIIDIENIHLNIETSVPCGLIINELVTNSIKYAFPEDENGKIMIYLRHINDEYNLVVSDDGIGFPEGLDFRKTSTLGLQLVNNLVGQLDGEIKMDRKEGTKYTIKFKELIYEKLADSVIN